MARPGEAVGSERQQSVQAQERPAPRQGREQTGALLEQLPGLTAPAAAGLLAEAPADVVLAALRRYAREAGEPAAPLLTELAQREAPGAVQAAAVEALGDLRTPAAADLAARWAEPAIPSGGQADHAGDAAPASAAVSREVRKAARRALLRLAQQGIHPSPRPEVELAPEAPARPERVRRAQMSAVDGEGTRLLYLLIDLPLSGAQMAMAIVSEAEGLLRFEAVESTGRQFERYVTQERPNQDFPLVEVPPTYARWLIGEAARVSQVARKALPPVYSAFREALTPPEMAPE
ncbi:MAG: hypothetical protein ACRDJN_08205, partial [Chloroflexota bacterium]